jgi:hypothetical protein
MGAVIAYVVSGTVAAGAVTPVDKVTHTAGSPIVIGEGAQSIAVTPMTRTGSPIRGGGAKPPSVPIVICISPASLATVERPRSSNSA